MGNHRRGIRSRLLPGSAVHVALGGHVPAIACLQCGKLGDIAASAGRLAVAYAGSLGGSGPRLPHGEQALIPCALADRPAAGTASRSTRLAA